MEQVHSLRTVWPFWLFDRKETAEPFCKLACLGKRLLIEKPLDFLHHGTFDNLQGSHSWLHSMGVAFVAGFSQDKLLRLKSAQSSLPPAGGPSIRAYKYIGFFSNLAQQVGPAGGSTKAC